MTNTTITTVQRYLNVPFLVAAHRLADGVATTDLTVEVDGPAGSARIVGDLCAISFPATWRRGRRQGRARIEITPSSPWSSELSITVIGAPPSTTAHLRGLLDRARDLVAAVPASAPKRVSVTAVRQTA